MTDTIFRDEIVFTIHNLHGKWKPLPCVGESTQIIFPIDAESADDLGKKKTRL